jgi:hypothetical protein
MRIASSGGPIRNNQSSEKDGRKVTRSDHRVELNSLEGDNKSLDPDHEPRKEGTAVKQLKQSPSVIEIGADGGHSDAPSLGGLDDRSMKKGSTRSPAGPRLQMGMNS